MLKDFIASKEVATEVSKTDDDKIIEEERILHEQDEQ